MQDLAQPQRIAAADRSAHRAPHRTAAPVPWRAAFSRDEVADVVEQLLELEAGGLHVSWPASIFEKSRMSLIMPSRCLPGQLEPW